MFKFSGIVLACAALLGGVNNVALAHGEKKHSSAPVVKEQTDWGIAGDAVNVARTIDVSMGDDMRFKALDANRRNARTATTSELLLAIDSIKSFLSSFLTSKLTTIVSPDEIPSGMPISSIYNPTASFKLAEDSSTVYL